MEERSRLVKEIREIILKEVLDSAYKKWKRENVTLRGMSNIGEYNDSGAMLGDGLYSASLSNKALAKEYGKVYYAVGAIPKNPLMFNDLNQWQIWRHNLIFKTLGFKRVDEFNKISDITTEIKKLGYDGVVIKGRELVNYNPGDVLYFENESQLIDYYDYNIKNK